MDDPLGESGHIHSHGRKLRVRGRKQLHAMEQGTPCSRPLHGFTLVELLVVIAIIGVLIGLLLPAIQAVRETARRMRCSNNLKQMMFAMHSFHDARKILPPNGTLGSGETTWAIRIMPFMEETSLFSSWSDFIDLRGGYYRATATARQTQVAGYYCPSRRGSSNMPLSVNGNTRSPWGGGSGALSDYATSFGDTCIFSPTPLANGAFSYPMQSGGTSTSSADDRITWAHSINFRKITDGLSKTIFVGEKHVRPTEFGTAAGGDTSVYNDDDPKPLGRLLGWGIGLAGAPDDDAGGNRSWQFGGPHPGTCQFGMGDCRVVSIQTQIDSDVLRRLGRRDDGEMVNDVAF
jgi:prepilin-type N-terminal cleavage/methylation domain-containing protein